MKHLYYEIKVFPIIGGEFEVPVNYGGAVYQQLMSGQDVHFFYEDEDTEELVEVIIPFEAVGYASIHVANQSEEAPSDAYCNDEGEGKLP